MGFWFNEEVEDVPDHVKILCINIFRERGFHKCEVTVEAVCAEGKNCSSNLKRLTASDGDRHFSVIAKMALVNEHFRMLTYTPALFNNESVMYSALFPKLDELQVSAGIPEEERFGHAQYYGSVDKPTEVIILEDLREKGYKNIDRSTNNKFPEILLALKEFAKFHALCFALKIKEENFYEDFKPKLIDFWAKECGAPGLRTYYITVYKGISKYFDNDTIKTYLKESILAVPEQATLSNRTCMNSKYSVIALGYFWKSPMYILENGKPVKIKILDFQQSRVGTPTADILFYILNGTDYLSRKKFFREWLDCYFYELEQHLSKFQLRSVDVYPRTQFETDLRADAKYMLGVSVLYMTCMARDAEERNQANIVDPELSENLEQGYMETVQGLVATYIDMGYLV